MYCPPWWLCGELATKNASLLAVDPDLRDDDDMVDGDAAMYREAAGADVEGATYALLLLLLLLVPCGVVTARRWEPAAADVDDAVAADEVIVSGDVEKSDMASCSELVWIGTGRGHVTLANSIELR